MLDDRVAFREDGRDVRSVARNSLSHTRNCLCKIEHLDRAKQCFARIAAPVMTLPTDQAILNERYRKACRRKLPHGGHPTHPAAYNNHVEVFTSLALTHFSASSSVVSGPSPVSTRKTASNSAGSVGLAFSLIVW